MRCPSCGSALGDVALSSPDAERSISCPGCGFVIAYDEDGWDACLDRDHTRDFSRQWRLWELGKLGDPTLVYGARPEDSLAELLACTRLTTDGLKSMRILEVGFGNGALLGQLQKCSPDAYGIDLVRALESTSLRAGSTVYGSLLADVVLAGHQGCPRAARVPALVLAVPRARPPRSLQPVGASSRRARVPSCPAVRSDRLRRSLRKRPPRDLRRDLAALDEHASRRGGDRVVRGPRLLGPAIGAGTLRRLSRGTPRSRGRRSLTRSRA